MNDLVPEHVQLPWPERVVDTGDIFSTEQFIGLVYIITYRFK